MSTRKVAALAGLAALLLLVGWPGPAHAQRRWVVVNGVPQTAQQLSVLDRYACTTIPNGSYWLDYRTGIWGYAGNPRPMGRIGDYCGQSQPRAGRPSLSERGMLYSSETWGRGSQ